MANMVNCTEVRPGNIYIWDNQLYLCQQIDLNKTAPFPRQAILIFVF